jgi:hypothetical protein
MKNWYSENSKWLIPTITFLGGIVLGFYITVIRYETTLEAIEDKVIEVKDDIHDLRNVIQNKLLTQPGE